MQTVQVFLTPTMSLTVPAVLIKAMLPQSITWAQYLVPHV